MRVSQGTITYLAADATSLNTLSVTVSGADYEFRDPTVDGGIDPGTCRPGEVNGRGEVIQAFCPRAGIQSVRIDVGEREDKVTASPPVTVEVLGGHGADDLSTGPGADTLIGGGGADAFSAGAGDDTVRSADGIRESVSCGDGADTVEADTVDDVAPDCETVRRTAVEPPGGAAVEGDTRPPRLAIGGARVQRVGTRRRFHIAASSTERGTIAGSGFVEVNGLSLPLQSNRRRVPRAGDGVELTVRLPRGVMARCRRAWRRGRTVRVRIGVVATDQAGNSSRPRFFRARLLP
jgi:hypothetical protein